MPDSYWTGFTKRLEKVLVFCVIIRPLIALENKHTFCDKRSDEAEDNIVDLATEATA